MSKDSPTSVHRPVIIVFNVRPSPKEGAIVAFVDVKIGPVTIHGVSIVKNRFNGFFVGFPVKFGNTGRTFPLVDIDEPDRTEVIRLVLEAGDQFTRLQN